MHAHMGIRLRRADTDVAQHLLDHSYVCAVVEQMSRKCVSKKLRVHVYTNSESHSHDYKPDGRAAQRLLTNWHVPR